MSRTGFLLLALSLGATAVFGRTASATMVTSAEVTNNCSIAVSSLAFGSYDPIGINKTVKVAATAVLTLTCTRRATALIRIGQGSNPAPGSTEATPLRRMRNALGDFLAYQLYRDEAHTQVWENQNGVGHTGIGAAVGLTVHGGLPEGQNIRAGSFGDSVTVSITF